MSRQIQKNADQLLFFEYQCYKLLLKLLEINCAIHKKLEMVDQNNNEQNRIVRIWTKISDETNIKFEMVGHIYNSISKESKGRVHLNSKNATKAIILDLINNDNGPVKSILANNGINSSEDFRIVIQKLCEEGLLLQEKDDNLDDFNNQFTIDSIDDFIKKNNLARHRNWYKTISYSFYTIGICIVILSYLSVISNKVGWAGWIIGMLGWALLTYRNWIASKFKKS